VLGRVGSPSSGSGDEWGRRREEMGEVGEERGGEMGVGSPSLHPHLHSRVEMGGEGRSGKMHQVGSPSFTLTQGLRWCNYVTQQHQQHPYHTSYDM
jgi:hypothetical protein